MYYFEFLNRVIEEGIEAAKRDYSKSSQKDKLEGSIAGFEACRNKQPDPLKSLLIRAYEDRNEAMLRYYSHDEDLRGRGCWYWRCFAAEMEWICNVVSAMLMNEGKQTIITPSLMGVRTAADILGIEKVEQK